MENFFQPSKYIVIFCGFLIVVWLCLQFVIKARVTEESKELTTQIMTWSWPQLNIASRVKNIQDAKIIKLTSNDAKIEVAGNQDIISYDKINKSTSTKELPFKLILVFYHLNNSWKIGSIRFN